MRSLCLSLSFSWLITNDRLPHKIEVLPQSCKLPPSSINFAGQAGRGNSEEFGLLSLEYDENFCMGGPGVIFSRETLRRGKWNFIDLKCSYWITIFLSLQWLPTFLHAWRTSTVHTKTWKLDGVFRNSPEFLALGIMRFGFTWFIYIWGS